MMVIWHDMRREGLTQEDEDRVSELQRVNDLKNWDLLFQICHITKCVGQLRSFIP